MSLSYALTLNESWCYDYYKAAKSEKTAVWWSVGTTAGLTGLGVLLTWQVEPRAIGWGTFLSGVLIGPSAGHFYAQQWSRGLTSVGVRSGIAAIGLFASFTAATAATLSDDFSGSGGTAAFLVTSGIVVALGVGDVISTPESVRKYNRQLKLQLKPEYDPMHKRFGIGVAYRF